MVQSEKRESDPANRPGKERDGGGRRVQQRGRGSVSLSVSYDRGVFGALMSFSRSLKASIPTPSGLCMLLITLHLLLTALLTVAYYTFQAAYLRSDPIAAPAPRSTCTPFPPRSPHSPLCAMASLLGPFRHSYRYLVRQYAHADIGSDTSGYERKAHTRSACPATSSTRTARHLLLLRSRSYWPSHGLYGATNSGADGL